MKCPTCGWEAVRFLWQEGNKVFASPLETGVQNAVRLPLVACGRCSGIFRENWQRVGQDEEFELWEGLKRSLGEDRNLPAVLPNEVDDE